MLREQFYSVSVVSFFPASNQFSLNLERTKEKKKKNQWEEAFDLKLDCFKFELFHNKSFYRCIQRRRCGRWCQFEFKTITQKRKSLGLRFDALLLEWEKRLRFLAIILAQ